MKPDLEPTYSRFSAPSHYSGPDRWDLERIHSAAARLGIPIEWKCRDTEHRFLHFPPLLLNWLPTRVDVLSLDVAKARQAVAIYDAIREALKREPPGAWTRREDWVYDHPALGAKLVILPGYAKDAAAALRELAQHLEENPTPP